VEANRFELETGSHDGLTVDDSQGQQQEKTRGWLREVVETILLAAIIWLAVNTATARFVVEGPSMEPNFHTGEFVLVSRMTYWKVFGEPQRGDVVVLHPPNKPNEEFIKRVVGLPGDTIEVREGQVYVNGALLEEPYIAITTSNTGVWTIGEDQYFVMGDNRRNSEDSRTWGQNQLQREMIVGKAWLIYWPPRDWQIVPHQTYAPSSQVLAQEQETQNVAPTATLVPPPIVVVESASEDAVEPTLVPLVEEAEEAGVQPEPTSDSLVGNLVSVSNTQGDGLQIREGAGVSYVPRLVADEGDSFRVEAGPRESDDYTWWYVVDPNDPQRYGWAAQDYLSRLP
jgi:signal peptidase I